MRELRELVEVTSSPTQSGKATNVELPLRYLDRFWNEFSADPKSFSESSREHYAKLIESEQHLRLADAAKPVGRSGGSRKIDRP